MILCGPCKPMWPKGSLVSIAAKIKGILHSKDGYLGTSEIWISTQILVRVLCLCCQEDITGLTGNVWPLIMNKKSEVGKVVTRIQRKRDYTFQSPTKHTSQTRYRNKVFLHQLQFIAVYHSVGLSLLLRVAEPV